jgi:DNA mismatch repair ATPase MutS
MKANHFLHRSRALFYLVKNCDKMNDLTQYKEFLKSKVQRVTEAGFTVDESMLNKNLFDFQRYIVAKALKMGKYAVFADCGLGKTWLVTK